MGESGSLGAPGGSEGAMDAFGIDPNQDPELAMVNF